MGTPSSLMTTPFVQFEEDGIVLIMVPIPCCQTFARILADQVIREIGLIFGTEDGPIALRPLQMSVHVHPKFGKMAVFISRPCTEEESRELDGDDVEMIDPKSLTKLQVT